MVVENHPFAMYSDCSVVYDGRASSTLDRGRYLVVYKNDGSLMIHGADSLVPRNYMGSGSILTHDQNNLIFTRKAEKCIITVYQVIASTYLDGWSGNKTQICKTEKELAQKIFENWHDYFDDDFEVIEFEFATDLGPIDLLGITKTTDYVIEVKRKTITIKDISQLRRYIEARQSTTREVKGYVAGPNISQRAMAYLEKHGLGFLPIDFDEPKS